MKKKLLRFVSLALASFVLGGISTCAFAEESESEIDGSNWMSAIKPEVPITAINMPGTHDSSTKYVDISPIFKTQDGSSRSSSTAAHATLICALSFKRIKGWLPFTRRPPVERLTA